MNISRKNFIKTLSISTLGLGLSSFNFQKMNDLPHWQFESLKNQINESVIIKSVELIKMQGELFVVVTAQNGKRGITQCNDRMQHLVSLLKGLVIPHFEGKDLRDLPKLVDNAYSLNSNYKYAGMPLWNCIGSVEIACWDLLGNITQNPVYELLGKKIRSNYEVYVSDFNREGDTEKIAVQLFEKLQITGAKGVKIKVGGRLKNTPENDAQTKKFIPALRKILGDDIIIYADANGSFSVKEGIETGKLLEDFGVEILEEPCNFEDEDGTRKVSDALKKIKVAGGEQDSSIYRFDRLARTNVYDILQPDMYYNGGILRALQVAEIAKSYNKSIAPHSPKADPLIAPFWQVAALIPNLYGLQETVVSLNPKRVSWYTPEIKVLEGKINIPNNAGLGIFYDESIFKSIEKL